MHATHTSQCLIRKTTNNMKLQLTKLNSFPYFSMKHIQKMFVLLTFRDELRSDFS